MNTSTFDIDRQDEHVRRHGDFVSWKRAFKCPCGPGTDPARANVNCKACGGTGFTYEAPVSLRGLVVGVRHEKQLVEAGIAVPGDVVLSLSPKDPSKVGDYDLFRLTWDEGQPYEGDLVVRGPGDDDEVKEEISSIVKAFTVDPVSGSVLSYTSGLDFTFSGKVITWVTENRPREGQAYSVKYDVVSYDWIAFTTPMQRFEVGTNLGRKVLLRKRSAAVAGSGTVAPAAS